MWAYGWKATSDAGKTQMYVIMGNRIFHAYGPAGVKPTVKVTTIDLPDPSDKEEYSKVLTNHSNTVYSEYMKAFYSSDGEYKNVNIHPTATQIAADNGTDAKEVIAKFVAKCDKLKEQGKDTDVSKSHPERQRYCREVLKSLNTVPAPQKVAERLVLRVEGEVFRPNGERYHPRELGGHHDVALLRHLRQAGIFARLFGPPGAGKTALVEAAFGDTITVNGHGDMTTSHFVGQLLPVDGGGWRWGDGPLAVAMKKGLPFFVDEISRIPTEVLAILYSVTDGRGVLRQDDRPDVEPIVAKEGFYVIAGYNPESLGARPLDEALTSRFRVGIEVTTDYDTALALGVPQKFVTMARNIHTRSLEDKGNGGSGWWVPQMRELLTVRDLMNAGLDEQFALSALLASCPSEEDVEQLVTSARNIFGVSDLHGLSLGRRV